MGKGLGLVSYGLGLIARWRGCGSGQGKEVVLLWLGGNVPLTWVQPEH